MDIGALGAATQLQGGQRTQPAGMAGLMASGDVELQAERARSRTR